MRSDIGVYCVKVLVGEICLHTCDGAKLSAVDVRFASEWKIAIFSNRFGQ